MPRKRYTTEQIQDKLDTNGKGVIIIGDYTSKRVKTTFKHIDCGYEWLTSFDVVGRLGSGCPKCFIDSRKLAISDISDRLSIKNISMIGEYVNSHRKTKFQHTECGNEWEAKPCDLLNDTHGCPKCAKHGFNRSKSAWSYVIESNGYIKYGITNNLEQRMVAHRRNGNIILHFIKHHNDGNMAKELENDVKKHFGGRYATKEECPDGYTETLSPDVLSQLLTHLNRV
jgi:hypothetical protein